MDKCPKCGGSLKVLGKGRYICANCNIGFKERKVLKGYGRILGKDEIPHV